MRLKSEQLTGHFKQGLKPVYLVFGAEPLLVEEAADLIRRAGPEDRHVWHVEGRFDWSQISWQQQTMSLFASQRLLEIRLPSGSPGKEGGQALRDYVKAPAEDTTLLIISGKITPAQQKAKWFSELERLGVVIAVWPVDRANLPRWIKQRAQQKGLEMSLSLATLTAERVEGNLFAAAQEIEKLQLLCIDGQLDEQMILQSVADNSHFEAFGLMDCVLSGELGRIPHMLKQLRAEGNDILAIFSALSWSLHRLIDMASQLDNGVGLEQVFAAQKPPVWDKSKPLMRAALARHNAQRWQQFLQQMAAIDQAAKGQAIRCPWAMLEALCLQVAGADDLLKQA